MADIPFVCYFTNVFHDEVTGLPPPKEVEFVIYLVPDMTPISQAPYLTAPLELWELKEQFQELLDQGLSNCALTLGARVLFVGKKDDSLRLCI